MLPLKDLPTYSVFGFISGLDVYLVASRNSVIEYAKNLELLRLGDHPSKELVEAYRNGNIRFKVFHEFPICPLPREARLQYNIELNKLLAAGYNNLRPNFKSIKYKVCVKIAGSFRFHTPEALVYVYAQSVRGNTLVLGIFNTLHDAEDWINASFPNRDDITPVFHDGELLREFRAVHGDKMEFVNENNTFDLDLE